MEIEELLKRCAYASVSSYDEKTRIYHIKKYSKPKYDIGKCYLVKISNDIVNNPKSVMATNWNNGRSPAYECLKIYVSKALGQNIYIDGAGYDLENKLDIDYMWSGWLNTKDLEQLAVMN